MAYHGKIVSWNKKPIIWCAVIGGALAVLGFFFVRDKVRHHKLAPFEPYLEAYSSGPLDVINTGSGTETQRAAAGKLKGKVIVIDMRHKVVDPLYFDLPEKIVAQTPKEVRTVVQLTWGLKKIGTYTNGQARDVQTCDVVVIDEQTKAVLATQSLRGSDPPAVLKKHDCPMGPKPEREVIDFLTSLPQA